MTSVFADPVVTQQYLPMANSTKTKIEVKRPEQLLCSSIVKACPGSGVTWIPATDVYRRGDGYSIRVDLPGVRKEDVELSIQNNRVIITGCRQEPEGTQEVDYRHRQICYGKLKRCIRFSSAIVSENIRSRFDNGVLEVTVSTIRQRVT